MNSTGDSNPSPQSLQATVTIAGSGPNQRIIVNPNPIPVPFAGTDDPITITWKPSNCSLEAFDWNTSPPPFPVQKQGENFVGSYTAPDVDVTWNYTIVAVAEDGTKLSHDPEIHNEPPVP